MRPTANKPVLIWFLVATAMTSSAVASDKPSESRSGTSSRTLKLPPSEDQGEEDLPASPSKSDAKKRIAKETKKSQSDHGELATTEKPAEHEPTNNQPKLLKLPGNKENEGEEAASLNKKDTHKEQSEHEEGKPGEHGEEEDPHDTKKPLVHTTDKAIPENSGSGLTWFTVVFSALVVGIFVFT